MDITGSYTIPAKQSSVWAALNDPDVLRECIPGCETLSMLSETEFAATILAKVGPVKARFSGKVELSEIDPNRGYRIQGEGSGGVAGFAKGSARVHLHETDESTVLTYEVDAQISGKLAQLGSRLITGVVKNLADCASIQNKPASWLRQPRDIGAVCQWVTGAMLPLTLLRGIGQ
jgi:uncharacterized protein